MEDIIEDLIRLGTDISKLTEKKLNSLANKLAKSKDVTQKDAKKIIAAGIKRAAKTQLALSKELSVRMRKGLKTVSKPATKAKKKPKKSK